MKLSGGRLSLETEREVQIQQQQKTEAWSGSVLLQEPAVVESDTTMVVWQLLGGRQGKDAQPEKVMRGDEAEYHGRFTLRWG
ncbi:hypothetical protein BaRGS_00014641 [Batillaria attramentaria]|uniref:Uncharacterized protein n=1 Tax=Batillaria attramentaria TaxID=370345 RepID=A0ABD0L3R4_9CAEN